MSLLDFFGLHFVGEFQFQKVRLWVNSANLIASPFLVSIPKGAIMSAYENGEIESPIMFQFQKVRLWATHRVLGRCVCCCFNSKRCDYERAIRTTRSQCWTGFNSKRCDYEHFAPWYQLASFQFQFQKVRLWAKFHMPYKTFCAVSIPKGAIMSKRMLFLCENFAVSIPKGAIMSCHRTCKQHYWTNVSIPKGAIMSLWLKIKWMYSMRFQFQKVRLWGHI